MQYHTTQTIRRTAPIPAHVLVTIGGIVAIATAAAVLGPAAALVGILVLGIAGAMLISPSTALVFFVFSIYANLPAVVGRYINVPPQHVVLALCAPLLLYIAVSRRRLIFDDVLLLMGLLFFVMLASAIFSSSPETSSPTLQTYLSEGVVLYLLVINAITDAAALRRVLWAIVLACGVMGSASLFQELTKTHSNSYGGFALLDNKPVGTGELDDGQSITRPRLAGPIGEPNRYAQMLLVVLPVAFCLVYSESSRRYRVLGLLSAVAILGGIALTFSRGAALGIPFLLVVLWLIGEMPLKHLMSAGLIGLAFVAVAVPDYIYRISTLNRTSQVFADDGRQMDSSLYGRAAANVAAWNMFVDHPILGIGAGQARYYVPKYAGERFGNVRGNPRVHNLYLEQLGEIGIIGFSLLMAIIGVIVAALLRVRSRATSAFTIHVTNGLLLAIGLYLLTSIFLHLSYIRYFWLLLALAAAAARVLGQSEGVGRKAAVAQ